MSMRLLVGLGNPGVRYRNTRHNAGFDVADIVAERFGSEFRKHAKYLIARAGSFLVAKPLTFMNLSGDAVASVMAAHRIKPENILVVCDDFALPFGKIRLRAGGSAGGHNGLKSVIETVGAGFARLRVGVGPVTSGKDAADFVLEELSRRDADMKDSAVALAAEVAARFMEEPVGSSAAGTWNVPVSGE